MNAPSPKPERPEAHPNRWFRAARLEDVRAAGHLIVQPSGHTIVLFDDDRTIRALDNRCPHMGFPLDRGTLKDGILTCHWHHARFDVASGGTFDPWACDVGVYDVEMRDDEVWVHLPPDDDLLSRETARLGLGLEQNIPLVLAKAAIALVDRSDDPIVPFRAGLQFGVRYRRAGWGTGMTIHTAMLNLMPHLDEGDRPRAAYQGLAAVAHDCAAAPARFMIGPLPTSNADLPQLKRWFRQFIEVRDPEGSERCIASAVRAGANDRQLADMLFAAVTDHRYIGIGHPLDFTNKALEALDRVGWNLAEPMLTSLARGYATAPRMEESNAWREPIDLIGILEETFDKLPAALEAGRNKTAGPKSRDALVPILLSENPRDSIEAMLAALRQGCPVDELAGIVCYAAALRIAHFSTSNEFTDWDTALHTFTFANAVHQGICRIGSTELLRGVFDAAMSIYLDRFLNIPAAPLPTPDGSSAGGVDELEALAGLLDRQHRVDEAGNRVAQFLFAGGDAKRLIATMGRLLLREDRDFHTIQCFEAAVRQFGLLQQTPAGVHVLVAAGRYLAAHSPTMRSQEQTYRFAQRLHRGERVFEE